MTSTDLMSRLVSPSVRDATLWELFHENSKTSRFDAFPQPSYISQQMQRMLQALNYEQYPRVELPGAGVALDRSLGQTLADRVSARGLVPGRVSLAQLATLLESAYGITRQNEGTDFPRPFRSAPSGGALYPLEIYFHSTHVEELEVGLYHYNPLRRCLRFLRYGDDSRRLSEALVQRNLALDSSLIVFITAVFDRSVFKYGDRGYRFAFLEAGHVAQNLDLAATAMGLGCLNIGGYSDRQIDDLLGLDGVAHSTIYMAAIGEHAPEDSFGPPAMEH